MERKNIKVIEIIKQSNIQNSLQDRFKELEDIIQDTGKDFLECLDDVTNEVCNLKEEIEYTYTPRALNLQQGDIIYIRKDKNVPEYKLKLGETCAFQSGMKIGLAFELLSPVEGQVIELVKNPPIKRWYQFWIKQETVGYKIQIL